MDEGTIHEVLSGRRRTAGAALARAALWAASGPYAAAMTARRWAYRRGMLADQSVGVPVICVGNLTTGGTGKTPMTAWVVDRLKELGRHPAILTRGYRAVAGRSDEAELLRHITGVGVVVDGDRVRGARTAVAGGADVLVMDDGFQHHRLRRDLDIVLIDATNPFGFGHCLPRGLLRESPRALSDAQAVVITRSDDVPPEAVDELRGRLARYAPRALICTARHRPTAIIDETSAHRPVSDLAGRRVHAFCGLGNPQAFFRTLTNLGAQVVGTTAMADHCCYTQADADRLGAQAAGQDALLVTTQKDYVKLAGLAIGSALWQLVVAMDVTDGQADLLRKIRDAACAPKEA